MGYPVAKALGGEVLGAQSTEVEVFETYYSYLILLTDYGFWVRSGLVVWVAESCD